MKPSIKPDINRIDKLVYKKINSYKERLPYEMDGDLVLTEFGAMKVLKEVPFILLSQYIKLFDHYKIGKADIQLIIKSIDKQAKSIETITNSKNTEFSGAVNSESGELAYDEWYENGYELSLNEFYKDIDVIKERMKASYDASKTRSKEFWIPVTISAISLAISLLVGLLSIFID